MTYSYPKSLAADFGGTLDSPALHVVLIDDGEVPADFEGVTVTSDLVNIEFAAEPDAAGKTAVDAAVVAFAVFDLPGYQKQAIRGMAIETTEYLDGRYPVGTQRGLLMLFADAVDLGTLPNRKAYLKGVNDWATSVLNHYRAQKEDANTAIDQAGVDAAVAGLALAQFDGADPAGSTSGALAISD